MTEKETIERLIDTDEFKKLQVLGLTIHDTQRQFDLLSVYSELIDEMAWSRLFAYLLDSTRAHGLSQKLLRLLLEQYSSLISFYNFLPSEAETKSICITEWKTESGRRIDILIKLIDKNGKAHAVIGIENKVDSGEQNNQIRDYQKSLRIAFPLIPKTILFLTPDGRDSQTSDDYSDCLCHSISYKDISAICDKIIPTITGQAQLFLTILKTHIEKISNNQTMDKEAIQLINELYKNPDYREAIKLISQYTPNVKNLLSEVSTSLSKSKTLTSFWVQYYPMSSSNPQEFKMYINELTEITKANGFTPCYMLRCENSNPGFEDIFTLRIVIWSENIRGKSGSARQTIIETIQNNFQFPDSLGTNKNWSQWVCVWTGNSYQLSDLGAEDIRGLKNLLSKGIEETWTDYKNGLYNLAKTKFGV